MTNFLRFPGRGPEKPFAEKAKNTECRPLVSNPFDDAALEKIRPVSEDQFSEIRRNYLFEFLIQRASLAAAVAGVGGPRLQARNEGYL